MQSASAGGQNRKELERLIELARVDGQQLVVEIQNLINDQPEIIAAIFMYISTVRPDVLFDEQPVSGTQKKAVASMAEMIVGSDKTTILNSARKKLELNTLVRAGEIERLKFEILAAMIARLMTMTPDAKCFQDYINIIRTYGTYADCAILDSVGLPEKTDVAGKVKGAVGASVGYIAARLPRRANSSVKPQERDADKAKLQADHMVAIRSVAEKLSTLSEAVDVLTTHTSIDVLMKKLLPVNTETKKEELFKLMKSMFREERLLPDLKLVRNKRLLDVAFNIEDCENILKRMCDSLNDIDVTALEKLQLYRCIQGVRLLLADVRKKVAAEMCERLTEYVESAVIEIDSVQAEQSFECPAVEVNLVKNAKGKSDVKFKPATIEVIKESARKSEQGIDTLSGADVCRYLNYIAEAGTKEQRENLSNLQPAMLPSVNPDQWLSTQIGLWGLEHNPAVRQAFLHNKIINCRAIVYKRSDLPYLRKLIQSVNQFRGNPDQAVKLIADSHQRGMIGKDDFDMFWTCVDAIFRQIDNPSYSMKLIYGMMNMCESRGQFLQAMSEYIAVNNDSRLKAQLTDCLVNVKEDVMRSMLFKSFISIKQINDGEKVYDAMLQKFNPATNSKEFYELVHLCAKICTRYGSNAGVQYILNCINEASSLNEMTMVFRQYDDCQRMCPLAHSLFSYFPAREVLVLLKPLLMDPNNIGDETLLNASLSIAPMFKRGVEAASRAMIAAETQRVMNGKERKDLAITLIAFIELTNKVSNSSVLLNTSKNVENDIPSLSYALQSMIPLACYLRDTGHADFVAEVMSGCVQLPAIQGDVPEHYLTSLMMLGAANSGLTLPELMRTVNLTLELFQALNAQKIPNGQIDTIMTSLGSILQKIRSSDAASRRSLIEKYLGMVDFVETHRGVITPAILAELLDEVTKLNAKLDAGKIKPTSRNFGAFSPSNRQSSPTFNNTGTGAGPVVRKK